MNSAAPSNIFITGATGFVGGAVALEYLLRTDATLHCLVRAESKDGARARIAQALSVAARAFGHDAALPLIKERVHPVCGDLTSDYQDFDGLPASIDLVLHAAASLKYADRDVEEIRHINVAGTANIVRLAQGRGAGRLCYVSTAYVAGTRTGPVAEQLVALESNPLNNQYERSKVDAEQLVAAAGIPYQVVRPSIVIGHSQTYAATSFSGMYGMLDEILRFKRKVAEKLGHLLRHRGIALLAEPATEVNLIPIDHVARAISEISTSASDGAVFHVVNGTPPKAGDCLKVAFELVGLPEPRFVGLPTQLSDLDRKLHTEFYDSYLRNGKSFTANNAHSVCGPASLDFPIDETTLERFLLWYLQSGNRRGRRLAQTRGTSAEQPPSVLRASQQPGNASTVKPMPRGFPTK